MVLRLPPWTGEQAYPVGRSDADLLRPAPAFYGRGPGAESQLRAEGLWTGELQQSGRDQRIQVRLHRDGDLLTGTLNLIDQGARDLKLDAVSVTEDVLSFQVYALDGRFAGQLQQLRR